MSSKSKKEKSSIKLNGILLLAFISSGILLVVFFVPCEMCGWLHILFFALIWVLIGLLLYIIGIQNQLHAHKAKDKALGMPETMIDVAKYEKTQEILKLTQVSIDHFSANVFWLNPQGRFVYVNDQAWQSLGYTRDELLRKHVWDIDPCMTKKDWPAHWIDLKEKKTITLEMVHRRKDGSEFPVEIHANYITHLDKEYNFAFARDITERKKSAKELKEAKEQAERYLDVVRVMIVGLNSKMEVVSINKRGCEILGYEEKDIIGKNWFDHFLPERFRSEVKTVADKLFKGEAEISEYHENPILTKNGKERIIAWHNIALKNEEGEIVTLLSSGEDITEWKKAEETLRKERDFNKKLIHSSPAFFVAINEKGKVIMMNFAMLDALGYYENEVLGKDYLNHFVPKEEREMLSEVFEQLTESNQPTTSENRILAKDGSTYLVEWQGRSVFDEKGDFEFFFGIGIDVTERREIEEALKQTVYEKDTLLNEVHHRVKNNLLTLYSLINLQKVSLEGKEDVEKVLEDTKQRISAMGRVHRMLYSSKSFSAINFAEYIQSLIYEINVTHDMDDRGIDVDLDLEPVVLNIDVAIPCGLIINELLVNSFRHAFPEGKKGQIRVSLKKGKTGDIELQVQDNGVGMEGDPLSVERKSLGLRLVTMLSEQLNAKVSYEGEGGSLFTIVFKNVTIPIEKNNIKGV